MKRALLCLVAILVAVSAPTLDEADEESGASEFGFFTAGVGFGIGHVELDDGVDTLDSGQLGLALTLNAGYRVTERLIVLGTVRAFSIYDALFLPIIPSVCALIGAGVEYYLSTELPSPYLTAGAGYPVDSLTSVVTRGRFGGFAGFGYQLRSSFSLETDVLVSAYHEGHALSIRVTGNFGSR